MVATFFARRYRRTRVGGLEKALGTCFLLLTAGIVVAFVSQFSSPARRLAVAEGAGGGAVEAVAAAGPAGETAVVELPSPFPPGAPADWRAPRRVSRFVPDNLYIKIDGRADIYLQFRVVSLIFGSYAHASDSRRTIDIYWYDMGQPENAQGIYRAEAPPDADKVDIGREGYQAGGAVFFFKGSSYVQVLPSSADAADGEAAAAIARGIAGLIADEAMDQWASRLLPSEGRVDGSLEFLAGDVFDLDFLRDVYTARYAMGAEKLRLFIHRAESEQAAEELMKRYEAFIEEFGEVVWRDEDPSRRIVAGEVVGEIDVVFVRGRYLGGVSGAEDLQAAKKAAREFFEGIGNEMRDEG